MGVFSFLFFSIVAFSANHEGFQRRAPASLSEVWSATALIYNNSRALNSASRRSKIHGAGILIKKTSSDKALMLTNAHIASCPVSRRCKLGGYFEASGKQLRIKSLKVIKEALTKDLALLELRLDPKDLAKIPEARLAGLNQQAIGSDIYAIGYPDLRSRNHWQTLRPNDLSDKKRLSKGQIIDILPLAERRDYEYLDGRKFTFRAGPLAIHSADTLSGNSGGPLVNELGEVVAINSGIQYRNGERHNDYCFVNGSVSYEDRGCSYFSIGIENALTHFGLGQLLLLASVPD